MRPASSSPTIVLSSTVRQGSSESDWKTKPRSRPGPVTIASSTEMVPPSAASKPETIRKNVVLPQPLGPTSATNSPSLIVTEISRSTSRSPKRLVRDRDFSEGIGSIWA